MNPDKMTSSSKMFDSLVRNAMEFLERSVAELKDNPKYAVIDFCTAIELFLKARLLQEHWVLIYEDPKRANLNKFLRGDFTSVGMNSAIERLREVVDLRISRDAAQVFDGIRQHRNKLVHFFHPAYTGELAGTAVEDVAAEQCKGWFHLSPLLANWCLGGFPGHFLDLINLNSRMLQNRPFLQVRFEAFSDDIARAKATGLAFSICAVCGFEASKIEEEGRFRSAKCIVCHIELKSIEIPCPYCQNKFAFYAAPMDSRCECCLKPITAEDLLNHYAPHHHLDEGGLEENRAVCGNGECYQESVAKFGDEWICLHCFVVEDIVWSCERCSKLFAGEWDGPYCLDCDYADDFPTTSGGVM